MPSLNVLFWNVQRKDLTPQIVNLAKSKEVDILVLAENPVASEQLVQALNTVNRLPYSADHPLANCDKITVITRFDHDLVIPVQDTLRTTTRRITISGIDPFLFTALHLPDKRSMNEENQSENAAFVAGELLDVEKQVGLSRHIVVGDFNMNPFEKGMVKAHGFHGTMSSEIAEKLSRRVQKQEYPYFYNPTWGLFGDLNKEAPATYYYNNAQLICYEWNLFDQVLVRPSLIPSFIKKSLMIVQHDSVTSLLTKNNRPAKANYSDHLSLFFTLKF